jgi:hypothetical protein
VTPLTDRLTALESRVAELEAAIGGSGALVIAVPSEAAASLATTLIERYAFIERYAAAAS